MRPQPTTYTLDPQQPIYLDLRGGKEGRATLHADRPFSIGHVRFAANYPHRFPDHSIREPLVIVQTLGRQAGTMRVSLQ
jgi:hypothetical protein